MNATEFFYVLFFMFCNILFLYKLSLGALLLSVCGLNPYMVVRLGLQCSVHFIIASTSMNGFNQLIIFLITK